MKNLLLYLFSTMLWQAAHAEVSLSANQQILPKINGSYAITQDLGVSAGNNLFHSFQTFNIGQGETASFSGAPHIANVISRVTGGSPSEIDGMIKNTIPGADTYLLNPAGVMFGEHAKLDVQGSFYAGTADALKFADGGEFRVDGTQTSSFSSAPPAAFGFLGNAAIRIENADLTVPAGKTLAFSAGRIAVSGAQALRLDETGTEPVFAATRLSAHGGEIRLRTPDSGLIELERSLLESSGAGGGLIDIAGGRLELRESLLNASATAPGREGLAAGIRLHLQDSIFARNRDVWRSMSLNGYGASYDGSLQIDTPFLHLDEVAFTSGQFAPGLNAVFEIRADRILMENGAVISKDSYHPDSQNTDFLAQANDIELKGYFQGERIFSGLVLREHPSGISNNAYAGGGGNLTITARHIHLVDSAYFATASLGMGDAGRTTIDADTLHMEKGAFISSSAQGSGKAGQIDLRLKNRVTLEKRSTHPYYLPYPIGQPEKQRVFERGRTAIHSYAYPQSGGGGSIHIETANLEMRDDAFVKATTYAASAPENQGIVTLQAQDIRLESGAQIKNDNFQDSGTNFAGEGDSGDVNATAQHIDISGSGGNGASGFTTDTYSGGHGGNINIHSDSLNIRDGGAISARSHADGEAGDIYIQARDLTLGNGGLVVTEAQSAGGGAIRIDSNGLVIIDNAAISTSVLDGAGNGGDLAINNPAALVLWDNAEIIAQAHEGRGGNIQIRTDNLLQKPDSLISASSQLGVDGEVSISSSLKISNPLTPPSNSFLSGSALHTLDCPAPARRNSLRRREPDGRPLAPGDWQD